MSSVLDVRTRIYCNLGTVISGNIQENTIVGAGLINVTGSILLDGVYRIRPGTVVELAYYKNGRMTRLGRKLRAISVYANPTTRTTEVALGCYLTYQKDSAPPPFLLNSKEDTNTPELTGIEKLLAIRPISARYVAEKICARLNIQHDTIPLTNVFYRQDFEISGAYLNVLSDLLVSENYVGYIDSTETLKFISVVQQGGSGPVLNENEIINIEPINAGDPDADVVYSIVNYKRVKLDASLTENTGESDEEVLNRNDIDPLDPTVGEIINNIPPTTPEQEERQETVIRERQRPSYWLNNYTDNGVQVRRFRYEPPKTGSEKSTPITATLSYRDIAQRTTTYDSQDRPVLVTEAIQGPWGTHVNTARYEYTVADNYERTVQTVEKRVRNEDAVEACGFPPIVMNPLPGDIRSFASRYNGSYVLQEKIVTTTVSTETESVTTSARSAAAYATSAGAANIQKYIESFTSRYKEKQLPAVFTDAVIDTILNMAIQFNHDKTTVSYSEKRPTVTTTTIATRGEGGSSVNSGTPPVSSGSINWGALSPEDQQDVLNRSLEAPQSSDPSSVPTTGSSSLTAEDSRDSRNGYTASVLDVPEILLTQNNVGGIMLELTPPYLSDDTIRRVGGRLTVVRSNATNKAMAFARAQNRLRYGYRNGQSIVYPVELIPIRPFSPLYLRFGGVTGQYRSDRLNIVFDSSGILVSTDAIFWGGVGQ